MDSKLRDLLAIRYRAKIEPNTARLSLPLGTTRPRVRISYARPPSPSIASEKKRGER